MRWLAGVRVAVVLMCLAALCRAEDKAPAKEEQKPVKEEGNTVVIIKTSMGDIKVELFDKQAPETVKNFLQYVDDKFYDGTIFHRVIETFMIQGGGFTKDMVEKPTKAPIKNEAKAELKNARGTIAMARRPDINSATAQFFINVVDNAMLDHKDNTGRGFGYCVFGKVVAGMDVVDKIKAVKTDQRGSYGDVPVETVLITEISRAK